MRVITRQNIWHNGEVHPAGSLVEMSEELASQLVFDGLVESVEPAATQTQEREPTVEIEPPKKQIRKRKK